MGGSTVLQVIGDLPKALVWRRRCLSFYLRQQRKHASLAYQVSWSRLAPSGTKAGTKWSQVEPSVKPKQISALPKRNLHVWGRGTGTRAGAAAPAREVNGLAGPL